MRTSNHVGGHRDKEAQVAKLKPSQKGPVNVYLLLLHAFYVIDSCGCLMLNNPTLT